MKRAMRISLDNIRESRHVAGEQIEFCGLYQARELVINLVHQVNHLVVDVQRHRGISMGLLAGNKAFEGDFDEIQSQISRRLAALDAFASLSAGLFGGRERAALQQAWDTIRLDWQDDKLSDNFELHSHFIEQLFHVSIGMAKSIETPLLDVVGYESRLEGKEVESYPRNVKQAELVHFTCATLPQMIESLAKIRGLASFSAAKGGAQYDHDRKLRFLVQSARTHNEKLRQCAHRLHSVLGGELNAKYVVGELETKFVHLIEIVTHDVLSGRTIHSSSSQLFNIATDLIDKYWGIVDEGLDLLRLWHRRDLESWIVRKQ